MLQAIVALTGTAALPLNSDAKHQSGRLPLADTLFTDGPDNLDEFLSLSDFEKKAEQLMSKTVWEFVSSGAPDEITLRWNREAFNKIKIQTHVLKDVAKIDTKVTLLGQELAYPILIAPSAYHKTMHPEGEIATAKGAGLAAATYVVSSFTTTPIEEIAKVATQPTWFQLYIYDDRAFAKDLIQKVEFNGCKALCITVDAPVFGVRNGEKFKLPDGINAPYRFATQDRKRLTWKDIEWIKSITKVPILLKGILSPTDAEDAVKAGVSGIIVSNHGARNLDTVPATIEVLPYITQQVRKRIPVLMDGGIRRGTDIVKAIALGANAVLVGRPICYGLACGGAEGVAKVLEILKKELQAAMLLSGSNSIAKIDQSFIWKEK